MKTHQRFRYVRFKMGQILLITPNVTETAGLLPAKFLRKASKSRWDVRENLFRHNNMLKKSAAAGDGDEMVKAK